jgi:hypothetical protein
MRLKHRTLLWTAAIVLRSVSAYGQETIRPWQVALEGAALGLDRSSGQGVAGIGARIDFALTRRVEVEGRLTWFPFVASREFQAQGGKTLESALGLRGKLFIADRVSIYGLLLPGVVRFDAAALTAFSDPQRVGSTVHFSLDTGIGIELDPKPRWAIRGEITGPLYGYNGETRVVQPDLVSVTAPAQFRNPWQASAAVGVRFGQPRDLTEERSVPGRWEIGAQLTQLSAIDALQTGTRVQDRRAVGAFMLVQVASAVYADVSVNLFPRTIRVHTPWDGGSLMQGFGGLAIGARKDRFGIFATTRLGANRFSQAYKGQVTSDASPAAPDNRPIVGPSYVAVIGVGGMVERYFGRRLLWRVDVGDDISIYSPRSVQLNGDVFSQPLPAKTHSLKMAMGLGFWF